MSRDFNGSSDYAENATAVVTAPPFTVSLWFRSDSQTLDQVLWGVGDTGVGNGDRYSLHATGDAPGDNLSWIAKAGSPAIATTTTGYTAGTWHHALATATNATRRDVYIDGGSSGNNTTSSSPAGLDVTRVGSRASGTNASFFDGQLAEVAVWDVVLDAAEIAALAKGACPTTVRPGSLLSYIPLFGKYSPEIDPVGGFALTLTGTSAGASHPRIYRTNSRRLTEPDATGGGTTVTPDTASLTLTTFAPTVSTPVVCTPDTLALTLTTFAPSIVLGTVVTPTTASLSLTTFEPTVSTPVVCVPTTASLTLTTFAPTVTGGQGLTVTPTTAALTLTTFEPTVSTPVLCTPTTLALTLSTFAPTVRVGVTVTPTTAALTLTTFAPTVSTPTTVTPTTLTLSTATFAPTVTVGVIITPSPLSLTTSSFAPTIQLPVLVTPSTAALITSLFAPNVIATTSFNPIQFGEITGRNTNTGSITGRSTNTGSITGGRS